LSRNTPSPPAQRSTRRPPARAPVEEKATVEQTLYARVAETSRQAQLEKSMAGVRGLWASRDPLRRRMLALADAGTAMLVAVSLVVLGPGLPAAGGALLFLPAWILAAKLYGLYDRDHRALRHLTVDELPIILTWAITCVAGLTLFLGVASLGSLGTTGAVRALALVLVSTLVLRGLARLTWRRLTPPERVLIVGSDRETYSIRRKLQLFSDIHAEAVGEYESISSALADRRRLAQAERIIVALGSIDEASIAELVAECRRMHVKLSIVPPARGLFGTAVQLHHVADLPLVEYNTWDVSRSTLLLKRTLDVFLAGAMLVVTLPLFLLVFLAVRLGGNGRAFYVQTRVGLGGREFEMFKFRTMRTDAEALLSTLVPFDELAEPVFKLTPDPRVTRVGRFLRRTSLDELPQLLNVLRGDMSLVGPRPEQVELVRLYRPHHLFRLTVKPGLTGPMQVFGRGELSLEERLAVEREYIEDLSISRDLRILALTVPSIIHGNGAH
jgi:exopolysaccharide biosynthesis polyprenyl glycosylphosphotransferase